MTFRIFRHEIEISMWTRPADLSGWQFATEGFTDKHRTRLAWLGPLHVAVCRV